MRREPGPFEGIELGPREFERWLRGERVPRVERWWRRGLCAHIRTALPGDPDLAESKRFLRASLAEERKHRALRRRGG